MDKNDISRDPKNPTFLHLDLTTVEPNVAYMGDYDVSEDEPSEEVNTYSGIAAMYQKDDALMTRWMTLDEGTDASNISKAWFDVSDSKDARDNFWQLSHPDGLTPEECVVIGGIDPGTTDKCKKLYEKNGLDSKDVQFGEFGDLNSNRKLPKNSEELLAASEASKEDSGVSFE